MKLIDYDKILFIDIDILPVSIKFYDIFDYNTPAVHNVTLGKRHSRLSEILNDIYDLDKLAHERLLNIAVPDLPLKDMQQLDNLCDKIIKSNNCV